MENNNTYIPDENVTVDDISLPEVPDLPDVDDIKMPEEELLLEANKWELAHGGLSGRCAQQFIDHLLGTRV